jgi:pimeloyl-ACP methyl ester carboxylesterase
LADWNVMAPLLAKDHHVVAMDVRGHGRSGDGPWSWNAAVEDVDAVVADFRMKSPAAMGHSLGGMIASLWGWKHPDATGVVNLDGHGNPRADQYVGLDPAWVADKRAELEALQRQQLAALSGPLSDRQVEALMTQQMAIANQVGAPEDQFVEGFQRKLDVRDGGPYLRPAPDGFGGEIYGSLDEQWIHLAAPPRR